MPDVIHTFSVGVEPTHTEINRHLVQNAHVIKSADQSVASSIAFVNDTHLVLSVAANTDYWVQAMLVYAGANGNFRHQWSVPSGAVLLWVGDYLGDGVTETVGQISRTQHAAGVATAIAGGAASPTNQCSMPKGLLRVGSNSGSIRLRWAQGTSSGTATVLRANSILSIRRFTT